MSLGAYNNNIKKKDYSPVTYSPVKLFNSQTKVDPSALNFAFWKGLLRISITPLKNKSEGSVAELDKDNSIDIYLGPSKAKLFLQYMEEFRKSPDKFTNVGVGTNKGIIYLTNGKDEFNTESLFLVIKLIDFENGSVLSCIAYEFNNDYFGITNYVDGTTFDKNYDYSKYLELDMLIDVLTSYVNSCNYAIASSIIDANKYEMSRLNTKIASIQEKLGIDINKKSSYSNNQSYWNNNGTSTTTSSSSNTEQYENLNQLVDDISSMIIEE